MLVGVDLSRKCNGEFVIPSSMRSFEWNELIEWLYGLPLIGEQVERYS